MSMPSLEASNAALCRVASNLRRHTAHVTFCQSYNRIMLPMAISWIIAAPVYLIRYQLLNLARTNPCMGNKNDTQLITLRP